MIRILFISVDGIKPIQRYSIATGVGAYFRIGFKGTTVKVKLASAADLVISIDGKPDEVHNGANGVFDCAPSPLANTNHTLRIAARIQNGELQFQGLILDAGAVSTHAPQSKGILEFIGNSITSGERISEGTTTAFSWLVGDSLQ